MWSNRELKTPPNVSQRAGASCVIYRTVVPYMSSLDGGALAGATRRLTHPLKAGSGQDPLVARRYFFVLPCPVDHLLLRPVVGEPVDVNPEVALPEAHARGQRVVCFVSAVKTKTKTQTQAQAQTQTHRQGQGNKKIESDKTARRFSNPSLLFRPSRRRPRHRHRHRHREV